MPVNIKIIYDKPSGNKDLKGGFGFACLIEIGGKITLFDAGSRSDILLYNLAKLKVMPREINNVFITHKHWDHMGGLFGFLEKNGKCRVVLPSSFSEEFQKEVRSLGAKTEISKQRKSITGYIFTSGTFEGKIPEQAAVVITDKGLVVIAGCAHPGIVRMIRRISKDFKARVHAVIGGFHLSEKNNKEVLSVARALKRAGVKKAAPCHCSGPKAQKVFKKIFARDYIEAGLGTEIVV